MQFLEFMVGTQIYAFELLDVVSIEDQKKISEVPLPAPFIKGMVMIRGEIMQVYDLAARLCVPDFLESTDKKFGNMLLVIEKDEKKVAMEITQAKSVITVNESEFDTAPEVIGEAGNFIKGLINRPEGLVIVIDKDILLGEARKESESSALIMNYEKEELYMISENSSTEEEEMEEDLFTSSQLAFA